MAAADLGFDLAQLVARLLEIAQHRLVGRRHDAEFLRDETATRAVHHALVAESADDQHRAAGEQSQHGFDTGAQQRQAKSGGGAERDIT